MLHLRGRVCSCLILNKTGKYKIQHLVLRVFFLVPFSSVLGSLILYFVNNFKSVIILNLGGR